MVERELSEQASDVEGSGRWPVPSLLRRFAALLVDWIACVLVSGTFANPTTEGWAPVLILIVEYGFFLGLFGQTPGMYLAKLRCVDYGTGGPMGVPRALLRAVLLALVVPALIMDRDRRGIHDRLTNSMVTNA